MNAKLRFYHFQVHQAELLLFYIILWHNFTAPSKNDSDNNEMVS